MHNIHSKYILNCTGTDLTVFSSGSTMYSKLNNDDETSTVRMAWQRLAPEAFTVGFLDEMFGSRCRHVQMDLTAWGWIKAGRL